MATIALPNTFTAGTTIKSAEVNSNFTTIYNDYNGNIANVNVSASAGIVASKLNLAGIAQTISYTAAAENWAKGTNIASATTTDIGSASGNFVDITGTTTITGLGTVQAGSVRFVRFIGILTLTHNATSLILPTGANIITAAGDTAIFFSLGSGNWVCFSFTRKDGSPLVTATPATALTGSQIQEVVTQTGAVATGTTLVPWDDTIPQITEGDEYMTRAITPNSATNKLEITVVWIGANSVGSRIMVSLFQDATASALANATVTAVGGGEMVTITFKHVMDAGTTSSTTFRVRAGNDAAGTTTFNGSAGGRKMGGISASSIVIREIKV